MNGKKNGSILYILITAVCFGTMEIALKIGGGDFNALQMTFLRFFIGGLFLLPFAIRDLKKRSVRLGAWDFLYLALLGIIGICISMTAFQVGVMHSNANTASVIISTNPVFTMLFAYFIVKEPFTRKKAAVLLLSLVGLIIVADPFNMAEGNTVRGILYVALAAVTFALYTALGKLRISRIGGPAQNSFSFLIASAVEWILLLVTGEPVISGITLHNLPVVLYAGIVVTGVGYFCYLKAIEISGPSNASVAFFIKPVIAVVLAALILSEPVTANIVIGILFILAGFVLNSYSPKAHLGAPKEGSDPKGGERAGKESRRRTDAATVRKL